MAPTPFANANAAEQAIHQIWCVLNAGNVFRPGAPDRRNQLSSHKPMDSAMRPSANATGPYGFMGMAIGILEDRAR